jgi:uncharacterized membrane protein YkvA (DUF1232 family)
MIDRNKTTKKPAGQKAKPTKKKITKAVEEKKSKATEYLGDPKKTEKLLEDAAKKAKNYEKNRGPLDEVWSYLTALYRLLRAYFRGDYRDIPWRSIVLVTVGIVYFVSPIDLIPDFIPVVGLVDDAAVIMFVVNQIKADLDNFLAWEISQAEEEDDESTLTG